jgi:tmRNA-binding protein
VEIAVARGKRQYDKREKLAQDHSRRDIERALKQNQY